MQAFTGKHGIYQWLEVADSYPWDLLQAAPKIVQGKYLSITSYDSGPLPLAPEDLKQGWSQHGALAVSPCIRSLDLLPGDQFDEWYIFPEPTPFDDYKVFVNYSGFSLLFPEYLPLQEQFWTQVERLAPESYFAEGDRTLWVTRNRPLFAKVCKPLGLTV